MWLWIALVLGGAAACVLNWYLQKKSDRKWEPHVPGEVIIKFVDGISRSQIEDIHRHAECEPVCTNSVLQTHTVRSKRKIEQILKHYNELPQVEYVEPNYLFQASYTPNDPFFQPYQYGPQRVEAPQAWERTLSKPNIRIAVVDSGVQLNHPDLASKLLPGYDFVDNDDIPNDGNGHGTHVAGIAAAVTDNLRGISGMAPHASVIPVRVLNNSGSGTLSNVVNGIIFAVNHGAQVINLSLGSAASAFTLQSAIRYAWSRGAVIIAAAGNNSSSVPYYPAYYEEVIAVASTNRDDVRSDYSNYGTWVDVAAPGDQILSTYIGGYYAYLNGTSMAAPHVAGIAALLAAQGISNHDIRNVILETSDPIPGTGQYWRYGRVNANRAVNAASPIEATANGSSM